MQTFPKVGLDALLTPENCVVLLRENCSVVGRVPRGSARSPGSCSTMPALPAPYSPGSWPTKLPAHRADKNARAA